MRRGLRHEVLDAGLETVEARRKKRVQRVDLGGGALGLEQLTEEKKKEEQEKKCKNESVCELHIHSVHWMVICRW